MPTENHIQILYNLLILEDIKEIDEVYVHYIDSSRSNQPKSIGRFKILLIQSTIFLFEPSLNFVTKEDKPLMSLDIEFAKFMKIKPEKYIFRQGMID